MARIAAVLEWAGEDARAGPLSRRAIEQISEIGCDDWRGYAWEALVRAYLDAKLPERALDLVLANQGSGADQDGAWTDVLDALPSKLRLERLPRILESGAPAHRKVELLAGLGTELERTGKHEDARRRVTEALALIAHLPKGKDALLELLAHELSFADSEAECRTGRAVAQDSEMTPRTRTIERAGCGIEPAPERNRRRTWPEVLPRFSGHYGMSDPSRSTPSRLRSLA